MKGLFKICSILSIICSYTLYISDVGAINTNSTGYKLVSGAGFTTIEAHGVCMQVRNSSGPDIFVPTKSSSEWSLFLSSYPLSEQTPCTHTWQTGGFGSCDATCGPGNRHQIVSCKRHNGDIVSDSWCSASGPKPSTTQSCNLGACILPVNGSCGSAGGSSFSSAPTAGLCATGNPTSVSGFGPWGWTCLGTGGGTDMGCSASISATTPGLCGTSNGANLASKPTGGLCSSGIPTIVTGSGPWNWNCNSIDGGSNMSCGANYSLIPANCNPGNDNGYNYSFMLHGNNQSVSKSINGTPSNGKTDYTATASCNNGSITITGETPIVTCNSGYNWDGSSCVLIVAPKCYETVITYNMISDYIGTSGSYSGNKRCMSNDYWTMKASTDCSTGTPKIPYSNGTFGSNKCAYTFSSYGDYWGHFSCQEVTCP